ncbi:uncharacterized protein ISCGN_019483 [Ixodes scapularis]
MMRGSKYKTVRAFGARKRSMKLVQMAKLEVSARRAVNDDRVNTSSDGFFVPSAVVEEERIAPLTPGVPSMPTVVVPPEIAGPSARLPPAATSGSASSSTHLRTHFLTREEIEAEARHRDTVQAELGAMPATQRKFEAMLPDPTPASATGQGPKPGDQGYDSWHMHHVCQKNTDAKSGRMEVEAALTLLKRSVSKHDLRYTALVSDEDSRTFSALTEENVYGLVPIVKEECLNHVQKRMGTALRNLVQKSNKPLSGKGRLTKALIDKLTDYYGWALRNNSKDVAAMQRAVMATYHHVTSTDQEPHHELCPEGAQSWCRHRVAEAKGEPQPQHKHKLPAYVAAAMLPVYQRLSQVSLLQRCLGAKTQNASESFHSVLWSLMPKEQHASLIAVETALHEAVLRFNAGCYKGTAEISVAVGLQPAHLALQRAAEKDALRLHKASKRHQDKLERRNKKKVRKNTSDYSAGSF